MIEQQLLAHCGTDDPLALILRGGDVRRYHAEGDLICQNVAEHSWRCVAILLHLWPQSPAALISAVLYHDVVEGYIGDTPSPVKRDPAVKSALDKIGRSFEIFLGIPEILEEDRVKLKICDYLEGYLTCRARDTVRSAQIAETFSVYVRELSIGLIDEDRVRVYAMLGRRR